MDESHRRSGFAYPAMFLLSQEVGASVTLVDSNGGTSLPEVFGCPHPVTYFPSYIPTKRGGWIAALGTDAPQSRVRLCSIPPTILCPPLSSLAIPGLCFTTPTAQTVLDTWYVSDPLFISEAHYMRCDVMASRPLLYLLPSRGR